MTEPTENKVKQQILLTCRTHEMILKEFPDKYGKPDCEVPIKDFHITLGIMDTKLQPNGFQLYIGDNVTYQDYLSMLKFLYENPLKENVFNKTQEKVKETQKVVEYDTL
jgi:hypothetical protein